MYDILIRGATVVTCASADRADLGIRDGKILAIGSSLDGSAVQLIEQEGAFVLPGYIDAHVHLNEPGREDWEGFETGTRALAAGGCTAFADMPLNSTPVLDADSFHAKAAQLKQKSSLDGALWGGLVPGMPASSMRDLAECGVLGFKAFMSNSGMEDFPRADETTLREGMLRAADLDLPVGVHAESDEITERLARQAQLEGLTGIRDYLDSRPIQAEVEAIGQAIDLARTTGCRLHIVHVSSSAGLQLVHEARQSGVDVTAETCPHYLLLDNDDVLRLGAPAKCAPPLRPRAEQDRLWDALGLGLVDTIGSDHSPAPPELKTSSNFFEVWGGISGCQHNYPLLFEEAVLKRGLPPSHFAQITARNVANRFRLAGRGDLTVGVVADLVLLGPTAPRVIASKELLTRHPYSAYVGRKTAIEVGFTIASGRIIHGPGADPAPIAARILRPERRK